MPESGYQASEFGPRASTGQASSTAISAMEKIPKAETVTASRLDAFGLTRPSETSAVQPLSSPRDEYRTYGQS